MMLWVVLGLMTAAAIVAVVAPLLRRAPADAPDQDLAVYRDQLAEIDRDLANGRIVREDAEAARIEVSRRLIAAAERAEQSGAAGEAETKPSKRRWRLASAAVLVVLPLAAVAFYVAIGSPGLPGQPLAERLAKARSSPQVPAQEFGTLASLVVRVETHLEQNPDDARGWEVLAPVYMRFERFDDAVKARSNIIRILGPTAERTAALGEALVAAGGGIVTPAAKAEFDRALALDRENITAILYTGLAAKQAGDYAEARRIWEGMIARAPAGAEWIGFVQQAIAALGDKPPGSANAASGSGRDSASRPGDAAGAPVDGAPAELSAEQREMARGMTERLAKRLAENGADVDEWLRLVRSYLVLGEREKAQAAAVDARRALAGDADKLQRLDSGVKALGVEG
jgi:cytochrome c-type biogenesis protein CcmH